VPVFIKFVLNQLSAVTMSSGRLFHRLVILLQKQNFLKLY